jgi:hypothetical protein
VTVGAGRKTVHGLYDPRGARLTCTGAQASASAGVLLAATWAREDHAALRGQMRLATASRLESTSRITVRSVAIKRSITESGHGFLHTKTHPEICDGGRRFITRA